MSWRSFTLICYICADAAVNAQTGLHRRRMRSNTDSADSTAVIFDALDKNHDGVVTRAELEDRDVKGLLLNANGETLDVKHESLVRPQVNSPRQRHGLMRRDSMIKASRGACAPLKNKGSHFTVDVAIGTPPQNFEVVADTGSNSLIVPSCICQDAGRCSQSDRCFRGTGKSSTFFLDRENAVTTLIQFGSGPVQAVIASDIVHFGALDVNMSDGVLLMTDNDLRISGSFEGILGLGLPPAQKKTKDLRSKNPGDADANADGLANRGGQEPSTDMGLDDGWGYLKRLSNGRRKRRQGIKMSNLNRGPPMGYSDEEEVTGSNPLEDWLRDIMGGGRGGDIMGGSRSGWDGMGGAGWGQPDGYPSRTRRKDAVNEVQEIHPKGLLEAAGVGKFSMCFSDMGSNGALRLGTFNEENTLGSIGEVHWGLGLHGISVGSGEVPATATICSEKHMEKAQDTPCGAIPDSGTTLVMAPRGHLKELFENICDSWDRCQQNFTAFEKAKQVASKAAEKIYGTDPFNLATMQLTKSDIFKLLLLDCNRWLDPKLGLDELPSVHFHVSGAGGTKKALPISGWSYVLEQNVPAKSLQDALNPTTQVAGDAGSETDQAAAIIGSMRSSLSEDREKQKEPNLKVCSPAFAEMDYATQKNGPVWILGTPLFYEFHVGYDIKSDPPQMSFLRSHGKDGTPCSACSSASLMSNAVAFGESNTRRIRHLDGPHRLPTNLDTSLPL